jgi:hypothetical protein
MDAVSVSKDGYVKIGNHFDDEKTRKHTDGNKWSFRGASYNTDDLWIEFSEK